MRSMCVVWGLFQAGVGAILIGCVRGEDKRMACGVCVTGTSQPVLKQRVDAGGVCCKLALLGSDQLERAGQHKVRFSLRGLRRRNPFR